MTRNITNLVGARYGPFEVIKDERKRFYDPVTVRTRCCGRVIKKKTVIALNTVRWRKGKRCVECTVWSNFTDYEHSMILRARVHGLAHAWRGVAGAKRMVAALGPRPTKRHGLGLKNPAKPHSPKNSVWMTPSELLVTRNLAIGVETRNGTITTIPRAARKLGLSRQAIHQRQERGYTLEEATRTPKGVVPRRIRKLRANKRA